MKKLLTTLLVLASFSANAAVTSFSYSGRLLDSNDAAVTQKFLTFQVKLKKGECLFYQEYIAQDLSNSGGYFTLDVGTGSNASGVIGNLYTTGNIQDINGQNCTITSADVAYMDIVVTGLTGNQTIDFGWVQLKNNTQSLNALKLQGKQSSDFISVSTNVTQASIEALLASGIVDATGNLNVYPKNTIDTQISSVTTSVQNNAAKDFSNVTSIPGSKISGTIPASAVPDLTSVYAAKASLAPVALSGNYASLSNTPTKLSQFTNDAGYVSSFSLPNIDWGKITGRPTTLDGYGITDSPKNNGGVPSFQSGSDTQKPTTGVSSGAIYFATDAQKTYYWNGSSWTLLGSVAGLSSLSTTPPVISSGGTNPTLSIVKSDAAHDGYVSASDWTNFNSKVSGSLSPAKIILGNALGVATATNMTGDVSINNVGITQIDKIRGSSVSANTPLANQVIKFDTASTSWMPSYVGVNDIRSSVTGTLQFFPTTCGAGQTMVYSAVTDAMSCTDISIVGSQVSFGGTSANVVLAGPTSASGVATFRSLVANDLPTVPWTKLGSVPTTVAGFGLTDAVSNLSGVPAIRSGTDASKPASGNVVGTLYVATDTQKIYQYVGSSWTLMASSVGSGGTISSITGDVTASGNGAVVGNVAYVGGVTATNIAAGATLANSASSASAASTIVKRDATEGFSAKAITHTSSIFKDNASNSVTIQAPAIVSSSYVLKLPTSVGLSNLVLGTISDTGDLGWVNASSSFNVNAPLTKSSGTLGIIQASDGVAGYLAGADWTTFNNKMSSALTSGNILVGNVSGVANGVPMTGEVSITNAGVTKVTKLQGKTVDATAPSLASSVLKYDGSSSWVAGLMKLSDIKGVGGSAAFPAAPCLTSQTLIYSVSTESFTCQDITTAGTQISGIVAVANGGTGSSTKNFVDLSSDQTVGGNKTYTGIVQTMNGSLTVNSAVTSGGLIVTTGNATTLGGTLSVSGAATFANSVTSTGTVSGASVTATGAVSGGSVSTTGAVNGATVTAAGAVTGKVFNMSSAFDASSTGAAINMSNGNTQYTTYDCGSTIALSNMVDGTSYNIVIQGASATICSFSGTGLTFKYSPTNAARTASTHTVYSMLKAGSNVYVWWTSGF